MVVSTFSILDKDGRERFFQKSFLLADFKPDIVLEMPFLTMSNVDIDFQARDLQSSILLETYFWLPDKLNKSGRKILQ